MLLIRLILAILASGLVVLGTGTDGMSSRKVALDRFSGRLETRHFHTGLGGGGPGA